ncbi:MAG TPA: transglycosylase family protein [Solirubrobacterales bacterium]|nr:transglycosylase family protein [Solirubrobacterales bacterium]
MDLAAVAAALALLGGLVVAVGLTASARAADTEQLEAKLSSARDEASAISAELRESKQALGVAEAEAATAEAHEQRLSGLLAEGRAHADQLRARLDGTERELTLAKARWRRSRALLAARLVAIYESGTPDTISVFLSAGDYQDLLAQADYLRQISESDSALADRVAAVRAEVEAEVERVTKLHERAVAYDERLAAARGEIADVRAAARASAAELQSLSASRESSLAELKGDISSWVDQIEQARAASEAEAEAEVGRWLGGPYSIPTYIVMCESGGDYSALNPSSGAGGAYQILPSTWELYGGKGEPQTASKAEQDRIAAEIWADSGTSAWVCG